MSSNPRKSDKPLTLPVGWMDRSERRERLIYLRTIAGEDERYLLDVVTAGNAEDAASHAFALFVRRAGRRDEPDAAFFDALTFADRHALIARLLIEAGKPEIGAIADCSHCAMRLEFALDLRTVRLRSRHPTRPIRLCIDEKDHALRLPTPRDARVANDEIDLVAACLSSSRQVARECLVRARRAMSAYDPLGSIAFVGPCAQCGETVRADGDLVVTWLSCIEQRASQLVADVHALALHYHWSERDILALPAARREAYLELCEAT
jgi:hypothetical protein